MAVLGNHPPRQCGIATFTGDLCDALDGLQRFECFALAMNDPGRHHAYPERVRFQVAEGDLGAYRRAADFLNVNAVDVVSLQHEYGIFGGRAGSHLLSLVRELRMPLVTTLHTILSEPSDPQRAVLDELARRSERLVVMSEAGAQLLRRVHGVDPARIDVIPHGIPTLPQAAGSKAHVGVQGQRVLLTFGLLSPDKGIEHVIDALPAILERHPDARYIVLGATHPHVKERHGETYRLTLEDRARRLGVDAAVIFHDRFVSQAELGAFLSAADLYITPYLKPEQITSGTLAYAVGCGKAVISTPYWYAEELLAEGRGVLVPWRDPHAIAAAVNDLLSNEERRLGLCRRAAEFGRTMGWPMVATRYAESFEHAAQERAGRLHTVFRATTLARRPVSVPEANLRHLHTLTDHTGLLQHAAYGVPRYEDGYCLDDNARALVAMALAEDAGLEDAASVRALSVRYLAFVRHAWNPAVGRFRNFMSYGRAWQEERGSEDSHGRAVWSLGTVVGRSPDPGRQSLAGELFHGALPALASFTSPRAWAFALLGIDEYLRAFQGDTSVEAVRLVLTERLYQCLRAASAPGWPWFEDRLTYANARLAQALLVSGSRMERPELVEAALGALSWLVAIQRSSDGHFAPVGSEGFFVRGAPPARFDQQPLEAGATVSACLDARRITGDEAWLQHARHAFAWYLGQNDLLQPLYDASTGGCRDGLQPDRVNQNQGAESTLSFLLALLELRAVDRVAEAARDARGARGPGTVKPETPSAPSASLTRLPARFSSS